jgi:hypothetical protein
MYTNFVTAEFGKPESLIGLDLGELTHVAATCGATR